MAAVVFAAAAFLSCPGNSAPDTPAAPEGPVTGYPDSTYAFSVTTTDPDGNSVAYRFSWGDGDTSDWSGYVASGVEVHAEHVWDSIGSYAVTAQAKDSRDAASGWSAEHTITISVRPNSPPETPLPPVGPDDGFIDSVYTFSACGLDPDNDSLEFRFAWGDGDTSEWTVPAPPGLPVILTHAWDSAGVYEVRVQSRDPSGLESPWSDSAVADLTPDCPFRIVARLHIAGERQAVAVSPDGSLVYAVGVDRLVVVDAATLDVRRVPMNAHFDYFPDIVFHPDGEYAYVAADDTLLVVRTADHRVTARIPFYVGGVPSSLGCLPDGRHLYVGGWGDFQLYIMSTVDLTVIDSLDFCWWPWSIVPTPDGKQVFVTNCYYDDALGRYRRQGGRLAGPRGDGETWMFVIDSEAMEVTDSVLVGGGVNLGAAMSPDGQNVYVSGRDRDIYAVRTTDLVITDTVVYPLAPHFELALLPDGDFLYAPVDELLLVVRTSDMRIVGCLETHNGVFTHVAAGPDGRRVYAIDPANEELVVVER